MKYIDADLLRKEIERHLERATAEQEKFPDMPKYRWYLREGKKELCNDLLDYMYDTLGVEEPITDSLQQEQPMPDSTKLIELWHEDKEKLKEKDFRNDPWRLAYNAFLCGFGRGIAVNKQEQSSFSSNLDEAAKEYSESLDVELQSDSPDCFEEIIPAFKAGAEWWNNKVKIIMVKEEE